MIVARGCLSPVCYTAKYVTDYLRLKLFNKFINRSIRKYKFIIAINNLGVRNIKWRQQYLLGLKVQCLQLSRSSYFVPRWRLKFKIQITEIYKWLHYSNIICFIISWIAHVFLNYSKLIFPYFSTCSPICSFPNSSATYPNCINPV